MIDSQVSPEKQEGKCLSVSPLPCVPESAGRRIGHQVSRRSKKEQTDRRQSRPVVAGES